MMNEVAVRVSHLTKMYKLYSSQKERLKESLSFTGKCYHSEMYALRDLHFDIHKGESVGIIGTNGSGKSTLLKIITGVLNPSEGEAWVNGKLSALLELGAGFNMEYTGIENIYLNGMVMGYSREQMTDKLDSIMEFADIGEFVHQPVKTYSSGMFVRLAFATQIFADPDVLIVDEALSVGDIRFQQKCYRAMEQTMKNKTVLLVTHDPGAVLRFCSRVIWLEKGKMKFDGAVDEGVRRYQSFLINQMDDRAVPTGNNYKKMQEDHKNLHLPGVSRELQKAGNGDADITAGGLFDEGGSLVEKVEVGRIYRFIVRVKLYKQHPSLIMGMAVKNRLGEDIFGYNTEMQGLSFEMPNGENDFEFKFTMPNLNQGDYLITAAIATGTQSHHKQLCWLHDMCVFNVPPRSYALPGILFETDCQISILNSSI